MSPRCSSSSWASQGLQKAAGDCETPVINHGHEASPDLKVLEQFFKAEDLFQM